MGNTVGYKVMSKVETTFGTAGTPVACIWNGIETLKIKPRNDNIEQLSFYDGTYSPAQSILKVGAGGMFTIGGVLCLDDIGMVLSSLIANVAGVAGPPAVWTYPFPVASAPSLKSRTFELTDGQASTTYQAVGCLVDSLRISGEGPQGVVRWEADWRASDITKIAGTAYSTLRVPTHMPTSYMKLYRDTLGAGPASTNIAGTLISWQMAVSNMTHHKAFQDGQLAPSSYGYGKPKIRLSATLEFNASGVAITDDFLAATGKLIRIAGINADASNTVLDMEMAGDVESIDELWSERDGNTGVKVTWSPRYNATYANYAKWIVKTASIIANPDA